MKRAIVIPAWLSCILNRNLCQRVRDYLTINGYELCSSIDKADIIIYSGCGVTEDTELQSHAELAYIEEKMDSYQDNKKVVLIGCFPKQNPKTRGAHIDKNGQYKERLIDSRYLADPQSNYVVVDNYDFSILDEIIKPSVRFEDVPAPAQIASNHGIEGIHFSFRAMKDYPITNRIKLQQNFVKQAEMQNKIVANGFFFPTVAEFLASYGYKQIIIGQGCKNNCSYCAIKFSRTKLESVHPDKILSRIYTLMEKGQTKFVLLCQDLRSWGIDLDIHWISLLRQIISINHPDLRLALFNARVEDILEEKQFFDEAVASGKLTYIGAMGQHVNKRILRAMNREPYSKEDFLQIINEYGSKGVHIHTYNIIGFPSETEEEFMELVDFMGHIKTENFSLLNFNYSDRKGTQAYTYEDKIPLPEILGRITRINEAYADASKKRFAHLPAPLQEALNNLINLQAEHTHLLQDYAGFLGEIL